MVPFLIIVILILIWYNIITVLSYKNTIYILKREENKEDIKPYNRYLNTISELHITNPILEKEIIYVKENNSYYIFDRLWKKLENYERKNNS